MHRSDLEVGSFVRVDTSGCIDTSWGSDDSDAIKKCCPNGTKDVNGQIAEIVGTTLIKGGVRVDMKLFPGGEHFWLSSHVLFNVNPLDLLAEVGNG